MRHTDEEVEQAARRFEQLAENLDPVTAEVLSTEDLREVAFAAEAVRSDEARLAEAVQSARAQGRSWNQLALALGVSRQAARQRFAAKMRLITRLLFSLPRPLAGLHSERHPSPNRDGTQHGVKHQERTGCSSSGTALRGRVPPS
jgi:hypothetical protein